MIKVTFEGGKELVAALEQLSPRVAKALQGKALFVAAEPMRARMAQLAPYAPGAPDLRTTLTISRARGRDRRETAVAIGPSGAGWYGRFQEFGTVHHGPQPFVRPGFDELPDTTLRILADELWKALAAKGISRPVSSEPETEAE